MTNGDGYDDEENEPHWPPPPPRSVLSSGPSGVTRVEIGGGNGPIDGHSRHHPHHHRAPAHPETDAEVLARIGEIISQIDWAVDLVRRPDSIRPNVSRLRTAREDLISGAKRFVTASKALVKSATVMMSEPLGGEGSEPATPRTPGRPTSLTGHKHMIFHESLVRCTDLVAAMFGAATEVAHCSPTTADATRLVEGILLVAVAFRATVQAAFRPSALSAGGATGGHLAGIDVPPPHPEHSLHDPAVKQLMSEATRLAASLTSLMKTIRALENNGAQNGDGPVGATFGEPPPLPPPFHSDSSSTHHVLAMI